jgi:nucleotide-binding universal stress UspA family protein
MSSYRKILVGTDGSKPSLRAVERAAEVARASCADLVIVCAYHPTSEQDVRRAQEELREEAFQVIGSAPAEETLREAADRARSVGLTSGIETVAVLGAPVGALLDEAEKHAVDLLVVGSRGLNTLKGRILGSVPAEVARRADCDVLVVRTTR